MAFKKLFKQDQRSKDISGSFKKRIALNYLIIVLIGALILHLKISTNIVDISFIDALFTATSAFSDTGLNVVNSAEAFNFLGQVVILILIQIGGTGIMALKVLLFVMIGKKLSLDDRMMIYTEQNQSQVGGLVKLIKNSILAILAMQLIFTVIMAIHMMYFYDYNILNAIWFGFFHSVSSINNAGFDITANSFIGFDEDYLFQCYIMILIFIGGLGFPVINDLLGFYKSKRTNTKFRFSLFTRISVLTYVIVTIVGVILLSLVDFDFLYIQNTPIKGFFYALFNSVSARNAGFATVGLDKFSTASQLIIAFMMFIGAAPASTGGGIRTTTFAIIILYLYSFIRNKDAVEVFNRRIPRSTIVSAFITFNLAIFIVMGSVFLVLINNPSLSLSSIIFEVVSAFGTTGLTVGITSLLSPFSKIIIIFTMLIGQIGISTTLVFLSRKNKTNYDIKLPEENVTVG